MSAKPARLQFKFDNFASLSTEVGRCVYSEGQTGCNRNRWKLRMYPGGERGFTEGYVGLYLTLCSDSSIEMKYSLSIINHEGMCVDEKEEMYQYPPEHPLRRDANFEEQRSWGWPLFKRRSDIIDPANKLLKDGALRINVIIQVRPIDALYLPPNKISQNMLKLLKSEDDADVSFNVKDETFLAHHAIIKASAPILASSSNRITDDNEGGVLKTIEDISPPAFRVLLEHVYSGNNPTREDAIKYDKELINAANKYELVGLKMSVENVLVQECVISRENVSDYILFADAQCCPLLKEHAITFFLLNPHDVLRSEHSKQLRESGELMSEMLILVSNANDQEATMSVAQLRKELGKRKLDVDGSKEALVARLEEAKRQRRG
ncbi:hypothetical protein ACHAXN_005168 [Cyclotella atomus]|jgi:speckle-type POZ protein